MRKANLLTTALLGTILSLSSQAALRTVELDAVDSRLVFEADRETTYDRQLNHVQYYRTVSCPSSDACQLVRSDVELEGFEKNLVFRQGAAEALFEGLFRLGTRTGHLYCIRYRDGRGPVCTLSTGP